MNSTVLFDVDGTLIDSVDLHATAWAEAFARFGVRAPFTAVRAQIGKGGDQLMPVFLTPAQCERFGAELEAFRSELFKRDYMPRIRPFPGVANLFVRLRRDGRRIVLASSGKAEEVEHHMRLLKVEQLVDAFTSGDDAVHSKPCPDIFVTALRLAGSAPDRATAVGDTPWDVIAAGRAGVRTIGVRSGGFPDGELRAAGAVAIYDDPADLLARYETIPFAR